MKLRDYAGYDPFDLLNSPLLAGRWARHLPFNVLLIQFGKRYGGLWLRKLLRVPASKNPKGLALILSAYCDLSRCGENTEAEARSLRAQLEELRSPGEASYCWGYDWNFTALRGTTLAAYRPNAIASFFAGSALLDMYETFGDTQALEMAESAGEFMVARLNRSVDTASQLCFSYTPGDQMRIYNSSALVAAFLARLADRCGKTSYFPLARRAMQYLADAQEERGSWAYGATWRQQWTDSFHTGYNLVALADYRRASDDRSFDVVCQRGFEDYERSFFLPNGAPKYFRGSVHPIDIHACAQAILTFCAFEEEHPEARELAVRVARWTLSHMQNPDGSFLYQKHRLWTDRTPYMRWGQAWMFRALAALLARTATQNE